MKVTAPVAAASAAATVGFTLVLLSLAYKKWLKPKKTPNGVAFHQRRKSYWDNRLDEEKLRIRRARILEKQIIVTRPHAPASVLESSDSISSLDDSASIHLSSSDERVGGYVTKNLKLYHYYDVEIKGRESDAKAYEKNPYRGYSSYNPSPAADSSLFKQAQINVKRLGDWNRRCG